MKRLTAGQIAALPKNVMQAQALVEECNRLSEALTKAHNCLEMRCVDRARQVLTNALNQEQGPS